MKSPWKSNSNLENRSATGIYALTAGGTPGWGMRGGRDLRYICGSGAPRLAIQHRCLPSIEIARRRPLV